MKTPSIIRILAVTTLGVFVFLCSPEVRSQQLITFTDGSTLKVNIVYQTRDSVQYLNYEHPDAVFTVPMDRVLKIVRVEYPGNVKPEQKVAPLPANNEYLKYKKEHGLSVTLNASQQMTGLSLAYHF